MYSVSLVAHSGPPSPSPTTGVLTPTKIHISPGSDRAAYSHQDDYGPLEVGRLRGPPFDQFIGHDGVHHMMESTTYVVGMGSPSMASESGRKTGAISAGPREHSQCWPSFGISPETQTALATGSTPY